MTTMTQKTTRVTEAQEKLIDEFKAHVNIDAIVKAFATQSQEFENAAFQVLLLTVIDTAEGVQLDGIGQIVGQEREGRSDADYRVRLGARILINLSSGQIEELYQLIVNLGGTTSTITEQFPAKIDVDITTAITNGDEIASVLGEAKAAGIGVHVTWFETALPFKFGVAGQGFDQGQLGGSALF